MRKMKPIITTVFSNEFVPAYCSGQNGIGIGYLQLLIAIIGDYNQNEESHCLIMESIKEAAEEIQGELIWFGEVIHVHVTAGAPLGPGYIAQSGTYQHQSTLTVQKRTDRLCPAFDLAV